MTTSFDRRCATSGISPPQRDHRAAGRAAVRGWEVTAGAATGTSCRLCRTRPPGSRSRPAWPPPSTCAPRTSRPGSRCAPSAAALTRRPPAGALAVLRRVPGRPLDGARPGRPAVVGRPAGRRAPGAAGLSTTPACARGSRSTRTRRIWPRSRGCAPAVVGAVTAATRLTVTDRLTYGVLHGDPAPGGFVVDPATGRAGLLDCGAAAPARWSTTWRPRSSTPAAPAYAAELIDGYLAAGPVAPRRTRRGAAGAAAVALGGARPSRAARYRPRRTALRARAGGPGVHAAG